MSDEEARKVKVGDVLRAKINERYVLVEVEKVENRFLYKPLGKPDVMRTNFTVRRKGAKKFDKIGNPLGNTYSLRPDEVGWAADHECKKDPLTANVFADFLQENGFPDAAKALRSAFPVGNPETKGEPS